MNNKSRALDKVSQVSYFPSISGPSHSHGEEAISVHLMPTGCLPLGLALQLHSTGQSALV